MAARKIVVLLERVQIPLATPVILSHEPILRIKAKISRFLSKSVLLNGSY